MRNPTLSGLPCQGRLQALQIRGVADSKSSAQRVGALCIAGVTLRMASHVLPCSRELMRSATDLPEDSKGTRTFLWPWVQHLGIAGGFSSFLAAKRTIPVRGYRAEACGIYGVIVAQYHLKFPARGWISTVLQSLRHGFAVPPPFTQGRLFSVPPKDSYNWKNISYPVVFCIAFKNFPC
jgi:hypothetical protein